MAKFLIIRFSSIGDIVLTSPVVRILKKQVPGAEIHFLVKPQFKTIIENNPYISKIHLLDGNLKDTLIKLKNEKFDFVIDLQRNRRSSYIRYKLDSKTFTFNKINIRKWLIVNFGINLLPKVHIVDRYLKALSKFNVHNDNQGLDYFLPENEIVSSDAISFGLNNDYIALVIGANHSTKRLPASKIISICNKISLPIILLGGKEDKKLGDEIVQNSNNKVFNAAGMFSLNQSAYLVKNAKIVITHDTGLMHIAAAFKKKIISIWGNTVPDFGMYPYLSSSESKIFEIKKLKCRPCSKIGFKKCPKKHFKCMQLIDEQEIANYVVDLWEKNKLYANI